MGACKIRFTKQFLRKRQIGYALPGRQPQGSELSPMVRMFSSVVALDLPGSGRPVRAVLALLGAFVFALSFLGAFGTAITMSPADRLGYFLSTTVMIALIGSAVDLLFHRLKAIRLASWQRCAVIALISAVPGAYAVKACLAFWSPAVVLNLSIILVSLQVLVLTLAISAGASFLIRHVRAADPDQRKSPALQGLQARLPAHLREAPIEAVQVEDHYLRVYTSRGHALVHLTMAQAEAALGGDAGMRVHRSYWVSFAAIERVGRRNGRTCLHLKAGLEVPVSRRRSKQFRAASGGIVPPMAR